MNFVAFIDKDTCGPLFAGLNHAKVLPDESLCRFQGSLSDICRNQRSAQTVRTSAAAAGLGIVQNVRDIFHVALCSVSELIHLAQFVSSNLRNFSTFLHIRFPEPGCGTIVSPFFINRFLNCQIFKAGFYFGRFHIDQSLQIGLLQTGIRVLPDFLHNLCHKVFCRKSRLNEIVVDPVILISLHQDSQCPVNSTSGSSDLLVISHQIPRLLKMDHEADVRLVKPHAKSHRSHQYLDLIVQKRTDYLRLFLRSVLFDIRVITFAGNMVFLKPLIYQLAVIDRQAVNDACSLQFLYMVRNPGQTLFPCPQFDYLNFQ